jgi:hypothetical protein
MTPVQFVKLGAKFRSSHLLWAPHPAQAVDHTSLLGMILMRTTGASNQISVAAASYWSLARIALIRSSMIGGMKAGEGGKKAMGFHTCETSDRNVVMRSFKLSDGTFSPTGKHCFALYSARPHSRLISLVQARIRPSSGLFSFRKEWMKGNKSSRKKSVTIRQRGKGKVVKCLRINIFVFCISLSSI